jgi:Domain of unknown function (DUF4382)
LHDFSFYSLNKISHLKFKKMKTKKILLFSITLAISIVAFFSCKKTDTSTTSTLQVRLTDAPTALDQVNVDIKEVLVKFSEDTVGNDGWVALATNARVYNLLGLQNGVDTVLANGNFPNNIVKQIRFILGPNNTIKDNGVVYPLTIPSGGESGLKIKVSKSLQATLETLIIDFDAALSVKKEGPGDYKLRPVLKIK